MTSKVIKKYARMLDVEPTLDSVLDGLRLDVPLSNEPITLETYGKTKLSNVMAFYREMEEELQANKKKNDLKKEEEEKELINKKKYLESLSASLQLQNSSYKRTIILDSPKTLPIKSRKEVVVKTIAIGATTTAYAGTNLEAYANRPEMFFESLSDEDCTVELNLLFENEQPFNCIKLEFLTDEIISPPQNISAALNQDKIPSIIDKTGSVFTIYLTPTYAKNVSIMISKKDILESQGALRKTFAISKVAVELVEYESQYEFSFEKQVRGFGAYKVEAIVNGNTKQETFSIEGATELDGKSYPLDYVVGSTNLKRVKGTVKVARLDSSLAGFTYKMHDKLLIETHKVRKDNNEVALFSKEQISSQPLAFETNLLFRNRNKSVLIATGTGSKMQIPIPISIKGLSKLIDSMVVTVEGVEWQRVADADDNPTGSEVWEWRNNEIYFGNGKQPSAGSSIRVIFPEENLSIVKIDNQYYGKPLLPYDPDPNSYNLYEVSDVAKTNRKVLPINSKVIKLDPLIEPASFKVRALDENEDPISILTNEQVYFNGRKELTAEGDYSIDYENGILYLYTSIKGANRVTVSYSYYEKNNCRDHLKFDKETGLLKMLKLKAKPVTDYIGKNPYQMDFGGKTYLTEATSTVQSACFQLSNTGILEGTIDASAMFLNDDPIVEVPFYNGFWELKGIKQVTGTTPTFRGADSVKSFAIENNSKVYKDGMFSFGEPDYFMSLVNSANDVTAKGEYYYDSVNGIIYFYLESTRSRIDSFNYSYVIKSDTMRNVNVFSVDYENGKLYTIRSLIDTGPDAFITYKASNYLLEYVVAAPLSVISYENKKITLNSNDLIKETATVKTLIDEIPEENFLNEYLYYTPFINNITLMLR